MVAEIIPLIANSGIQFIEQRICLDENSPAFEVRSRFAEVISEVAPGKKEYEIIFPYLFKQKEQYIYKDSINKEAIDKKTGKIIEDNIKDDYVKYLDQNKGDVVYSAQARESIETFEGTWLPIPYFRKAGKNKVHAGPKTWARMWFSKIPTKEKKDDNNTHYVVLAFDTRCEDIGASDYVIPQPIDAEHGNVFRYPENEDANFNFCASDWVQEWLDMEYEERKVRKSKYQFFHIALYFNLLRVISKAGAFPEVSLHSIDQFERQLSNEVDLILDIGNSRTCGLLYETSKLGKPFKFEDAVPLKIRDLTYPIRSYDDPFSMQLAFIKATFGREIVIPDNIDAFKWTSFLRVGAEASRHIVINSKTASNFSMSSPKRYLWDDRRMLFPWEFIVSKKEDVKSVGTEGAIIDGLNELFTSDGEFLPKAQQEAKNKGKTEPSMGLTPYYSKKSMMTFVFIEILLQALVFINSYTFRKKHGDVRIPRKLKRLVLTCPTAMVQKERFYLRDLALDAVKSLSKIFGQQFVSELDIEIIPDPKDIKKLAKSELDPDEKKMVRTWAYDEATCSQLTFMYGEIGKRYKGKTSLFFNLNGKLRQDALYPEQPSVTVASVDIGGGTTDMMICNYQYAPEDSTVVTPDPIFWEGFNLAGDDILLHIIESFILPTITDYAQQQNCNDTVEAMSFLFGHNMQPQEAYDREMRKQFAAQIAIPIGYQFIQHAIDEDANQVRKFPDFFINYNTPNPNLVAYINKNFRKRGATNFDLREVSWNLNGNAINTAVRRVVERMLKELSVVIAQYQCDYILLAGRPTTMPVIREIFLKYLPAFADRIIQLGNYRIGQWYPFADAAGRIKDPKTCVAVGATIALMSNLGRLSGFRFETKLLKDKQKSTADFIGKYEINEAKISNIYFTPKQNYCTLIFNSPMLIGMKQLKEESWIGTPIYKLDFASSEIAAKLSSRMPLRVDIERDYHTDKEAIERIEAIRDNEQDEIMPNSLVIKLQTLPDEYGYWMDTGSFKLNIFYNEKT